MRDPTAVWSVPKRLGFLILALFLCQNAGPLVVGVLPYLGDTLFLAAHTAAWSAVVPWLGEHVLGLAEPITILPNGSGDTTWNYVQLFGMVMLSLIVGTAWALADRKRPGYARLDRWLQVLVRYGLSAAMLNYGLVKVFKSQFPFPSLNSLTSTYGESSPMGLAWNFMGYSSGYNLFAGGAEVLAGVLLLWRRTATLGALVAIGVMANVAAMNFCYDIPVKLFSSTLLLMGLYLFACDGRRFVDLFIRNRPTEPADLSPHFTRKRARVARVVAKSCFVLLMGLTAVTAYFMSREYGDTAPRPPLYGLYEVETYSVNAVPAPPLTTDDARWRRLIVEAYGFAVVRTMTDRREFFQVETDTEAHTLTLTTRGKEETPVVHEFAYEQPSPDQLVLRGALPAGPLVITLKKVDPQSFLLVSRGFRWVNEYPFNR